MALDASERAALQQMATDLFEARADLHHERVSIDRGREHLRGALGIIGTKVSDGEKVQMLCALIDEARDMLGQRREK